MFISVGYVIIVVAIFVGWFVVLERLFNYSDGKSLQAVTILRDLLSYLTVAFVWTLSPLWIFQKNS